MAVLAVVLCGVMLFFMNRKLDIEARNRAEQIDNDHVQESEAATPPGRGAVVTTTAPELASDEEVLMPHEAGKAFADASAVLRRAVPFSTAESLGALVRHPDITLPRCRAWSPSRPMTPMVPLKIGPKFGIMEELMVTTLLMQDGSARPVVMEKTAQGYLLDWESLAGWGECSFKDVPKLPVGQRTLLRVNVRSSSELPSFTHELGMSFILAHPEEDLTLTAHVTEPILNKSAAGQLLRVAEDAPFVLRIAVDEDCLKHGWVRVAEVVCSGWVTDL